MNIIQKIISFLLLSCIFVFSGSLFAKEQSAKLQKKIITMDFQKIPIRELLQFIAQTMNLNIIMSDSVAGNVSLHFRALTWEQALDTLLEMSGLVKRQKESMLFIATASEFAARQKSLQEAAPIKMLHVKLHHTNVNEISAELKSNPDLLSSFAKIAISTVDNSLWIKETVDNLPLITNYLRQVDKPQDQIMVAAKIINVDNKKIHELGLCFNPIPKADNCSQLHFSFPVDGRNSLSLAIASIAQGQLLNLQLEALESAGYSKIMANPKVITQNRKPALIEAGEEIPYQESTSSGATSVTFKKAALSLKVTPTLLPDNRIILELEINQNKTSPLAVNGTPAIQTQVVKTEVVVGDGQTLVLGGIFEKSLVEYKNKIPVLSDIPLIGGLLSQKGEHVRRKELLLFVTPSALHHK